MNMRAMTESTEAVRPGEGRGRDMPPARSNGREGEAGNAEGEAA
jgi:hypothetical protein